MLRIAICDDNEKDIEVLEKNLNSFAEETEIQLNIEKFLSGNECLNVFENSDDFPEVLYLDMHMPSMDGMETATKLRKAGYSGEIIFNTVSEPEVYESFFVDAFHYIVKGKTDIETQRKIFHHAVEEKKKKEEDFITVSCAGESVTIGIKEIKYFSLENKVIVVHYRKKKTFEFYTSLNKIQYSLLNKGFVRVNSHALVNMSYITRRTKGDVSLFSGEKFDITRTYRKDANTVLDKFQKKREVFRL
ncbi:MAG: LytTR family DNA-binding domain-containing protein [Lachnospiraceae bacterium]|jgi:DNA-binding LytR/AlgR family response regulator|nr:LytTR family DNA-binding domain-containing protein [Lachnospiraceae bacterium]